jgi:ammonium transporter, Amt family
MPVYLLFVFIWSTFVYDVVAYWTWAPNGWLYSNFEALDFAGGTPVHIVSGFSALAYSIAVGPRKTVNFKKYKPSNVSDVYLGTAILWFGWFGFNGGSELAINSRAVNAVIVSNLAASVGGLTWMFAEMIKGKTMRMSLNGLCAGTIAGLVTITPAAGFVTPYFSVIFGFIGALSCLFACEIKTLTKHRFDDACDVFGSELISISFKLDILINVYSFLFNCQFIQVHGIGGVVSDYLNKVRIIFKVNFISIIGGMFTNRHICFE